MDDFELIIINDGSTDSSGHIAEEMKKTYSNVKVFHKENGGLSSARNYGMDRCNGKYIMFLDSDDYLTDNCIEEIIKICKEENVKLLSKPLFMSFLLTSHPAEASHVSELDVKCSNVRR